ncbi:DUF6268 family outer membrane beta-barrel protein [Sphingobacterium psychroaquaticum]|uniref:DUF6268 domain-containing protein n=1 Tax=Sphingobacterium psychroaquaticum TaxID=561061 RepID=A0A1X7JPR1_9SPHI|nr:DUF6268 family outer membrane beta-barrel protein [Sphingobacterium psychroaquaticum]SMG30010.1 hypothetical protein SAMN05660862_2002 [Sphingobacterium psychroaquaticum]
MIENFSRKKLSLLLIMALSYTISPAQVSVELKSEYIGKSSYRFMENEKSEKVGDSKGGALIHQGSINIPLSFKLNEKKRPTMWALSVAGAYAKLDNENFTEPLVVDEIVNAGINLNHLRPLNDRWSMLASIGGGIYMPSTKISDITLNNTLGNAGIVFIRHLKPNLDLGGGVAFNNSFGTPMLFPAFYLNWRTEGKYSVNIALMNGLAVSAGYDVGKSLRISVIGEMNGQVALLEQDGEGKMFSHMYMIGGLRPEIKIGKKLSIPLTGGISAWRPAQMNDRTLKSIFKEQNYYFQSAIYASAGLKMKF